MAEIGDGMLVGLGSGSTAACAVRAVGRRVAEGLRVECVATSRATEALARSAGLTIRPFDAIANLRHRGLGGGCLFGVPVVRAHEHRSFSCNRL